MMFACECLHVDVCMWMYVCRCLYLFICTCLNVCICDVTYFIHIQSNLFSVSTLKGTPNLYFLSEVLTISTG